MHPIPARLKALFTPVKAIIFALLFVIGWVLKLFFGQLEWQRPRWLEWVGERLGAAVRWGLSRPKAVAIALLVMVLLGVGGWYGYAWWKARPKPVEVSFEVAAPGRTEIENEGGPNPLVVKFARSVAPLVNIGKSIAEGVKVSPVIEGEWRWTDDKHLQFSPKSDWPIGTEYTVTFDKKLVAPQIQLAKWDFTFFSPVFEAKLVSAEFYQDPVNPALKKVVLSLNFSHPVDTVSLEKRISMQMAGASSGVLGIGAEKTPFVVTYDKFKLNAYVHSQPLPIPKEETALEVLIAAGVQAARGGNATTAPIAQSVQVPGLYSLTVSEPEASVVTDEQNEPQQVLVLGTSAAVHEKEMQKAVSAWVLPVHSAKPDEDGDGPHQWQDVSEITPALLTSAKKLALSAIPAEREFTETHAFHYNADVGRFIYVQVNKGVKSFGGYLLGERQHFVMQVPPFPSELKILSQGALLALSGEKKVAVLVRDLPGVKVEIGRVLPGQLQHLISQSSGSFANPEFYGSFGQDNLTERYENKVPLPDLKRGKAHYEAVDLGAYLNQRPGEERRGVFLLTVRGYDPATEEGKAAAPQPQAMDEETGSESEEGMGDAQQEDVSQRVDKRLILVTDLGIIVKRELDGTQRVYVQSIHTGLPVAGATVDVVARNGVTLYSESTDAQGMVRFSKLEGLTRERTPMMYLVRKAGDLSFLPLNRGDRSLDFSRFDVGGVANAREADQLAAYLFSDRGIYRPGDTFHIGLIVKAASWGKPVSKPLDGLPLEVEVLDARGLTVQRERIRLAGGGFNEIAHTTMETSPTGSYTINLYTVKDGKAGQQLGSTTVKVQEFQPDRMKASVHLSTEVSEGWVQPKDLKATVNVMNLFGTPAENRRIEAILTLSPAFPAFRSFADYSFYDPQRAKEGYSEQLPEGVTDAQGNASVELGLEKYAKATYRLHLLTRAFEAEGGRSVAAETATLVSEQPFLIGIKADGALDFVSRGSKRAISVIAINPQAKKITAEGLKLALVERKYVSVLMRQSSGLYRYESRKKEVTIKETPFAIPAGGASLALATDTPGNYAWVFYNADGLEMNRVEYSVAGQGNVSRSLERNAELQLSLNKKDYAPGEEIEISIRAP